MRHTPNELIIKIFEYFDIYKLKKYILIDKRIKDCINYIIKIRSLKELSKINFNFYSKKRFIDKANFLISNDVFIFHIIEKIVQDQRITNTDIISLSLIFLFENYFFKKNNIKMNHSTFVNFF
jgi:hypothetical protein